MKINLKDELSLLIIDLSHDTDLNGTCSDNMILVRLGTKWLLRSSITKSGISRLPLFSTQTTFMFFVVDKIYCEMLSAI